MGMSSCSVCMFFVRLGHHDGYRLHGPATCLPHKDGGIPLSALPKDTTSKLGGLFSTLPGVVVRASASQSVNLGFIFQVESTKRL